MKLEILFLSFFLVSKCVQSKNILFYWGFSGYSHRISVWPLVEKLIQNGHNVTFFSPLLPKSPNPNVTEITPANILRKSGLGMDLLNLRVTQGSKGIEKLWPAYFDFAINHCNAIFDYPELVDWIESVSYDLVIINALFNDCALGLAHKFKAPHIIYGTMAGFGWWSESYGHPVENYPEFTFHYPLDMTFLESMWNTLRPLYWYWNRIYYMLPRIEETLKKGLKLPEMPSLLEMEKNVSLIFSNGHASEEFSRSLPPLFVEIGGMHCSDEIKPLPKEIKDFVESGSDGFIYFSFGTFATAGNLPQSIQSAIFGAMKGFNTKFLVKWNGNLTDGVSENVRVVPWVSQQDVLGHPKIRAFISHGGLLGTQEAVYHGVPMIVIPLFADQDYNADRVTARKRGLMLEISTLTQQKLEDAIKEIVNNKIYMANSKKVSRLFRDRPVKPVDTALWWVEYVLRNKDISHLRPIGMSKNWYQRRMLDVWGILAVSTFMAIVLIVLITRYVLANALAKAEFCKTGNISANHCSTAKKLQ